MKRTKEEKISIAMSCAALVLFAVSLVTGLMPNLESSIDKICFFLGIALTCLAATYVSKAKSAKVNQ